MKARLDWLQAAPKALVALRTLNDYAENSGLDHKLLELVKTRASQINGCAYCLHMHTADARKRGETEERLYLLSAWRESPLYSPRERAALAWTEALTTLTNREVPDEVFAQVREQFSERELSDLTLAVLAINSWNRINVAFHTQPVPFEIAAPEREAVSAD